MADNNRNDRTDDFHGLVGDDTEFYLPGHPELFDDVDRYDGEWFDDEDLADLDDED